MDSSKKLYIALAVLVALAGGVFLQQQEEKKEASEHSLAARQADLPKLEFDEEAQKAVDTIELSTPAKEGKPAEGETPATDAKPAQKIVLKKAGEDDWKLAEPVSYAANTANVKSLLENLTKLKVQEQISPSTDTYEQWGLDDEQALRAQVKQGDQVVLDLYFGESGSRGQMVRIAGKDGVYAVKGYSKFLYERDAAAWRDKGIFKFEEKEAEAVRIKNEHGEFSFKRADGKWTGTFNGAEISDFKPSKVDDMLRAYKSLNAADFGDGKSVSDVGLEEPTATVTIETKDGGAKYQLLVGNTSEGENRWVKANNSDTIFSISSWSADWATAEPSKFQGKEANAEAKPDEVPPSKKVEAVPVKPPAPKAPTKDVPAKAETPKAPPAPPKAPASPAPTAK